MAILKKGSKGSPVKDLQQSLNKFGAKPALEVDGIFGPKTEAALKAAQKKLGLKFDGIEGEVTRAALKYGKPLPEWEVRSYKGIVSEHKAVRKLNTDVSTTHLRIAAAIDQLDKLGDVKAKTIEAYIKALAGPRAQVAQLGAEIEKLETSFEKERLKSPAAAERYAKVAKSLDKKYLSDTGQLQQEVGNLGKECADLRNAAKSFADQLDKQLKGLEKIVDTYFKALDRVK